MSSRTYALSKSTAMQVRLLCAIAALMCAPRQSEAAENCVRRFARLVVPGLSLKLPLLSKGDAEALRAKITSRKYDPYDFSYFKGTREEILVAADKDIDPVLAKWLMESSRVYSPADADAVKVEKLARFTRDTLYRSYNTKKHPLSNFIFNNLNRRSPHDDGMPWSPGTINHTLLGDYISTQTGECRHQATALALALRKAGYESEVLGGNLFVSGPNVPNDRNLHAWIAVKLGNDYFLVDSSNSIFKPKIMDVSSLKLKVPVKLGKERKDADLIFESTWGTLWHPLSSDKVKEFEENL